MISNTDIQKWKLNINPKCNIPKEKILSMIKNKSLGEINDILNLYVADNANKEEEEEKEKKKKPIQEDTLTIKSIKDEMVKIKKSKNISENEKLKMLGMSNDMINILQREKKMLKNRKEMREEFDTINKNMKKISEEKMTSQKKKYYEKTNDLFKKYDEEKNKLLDVAIKNLKLDSKYAKKYMETTIKEKDEFERKKRIEENVNKLKVLLLNNDNVKKEEEEKTENRIIRKEKFKNVLSLIKEKYGPEIGKIYSRKLTKKSKLNRRVKFVLQMLSHYKFRQHLINKSDEYGCEILTVTEEFTSKTCTKCGHIGNNFEKRIKNCSNCDYKINRDIGGSRNILIKNLDKILK
jgi:transposase